MKRAVLAAAVLIACAIPQVASATAGVQHLHFSAGPYSITPGANLILVDRKPLPKPNVDGYMVRMAPNLHYALPNGKCCGAIPRVDVIHLHHGVWLSNGKAGAGEGNGYVAGLYPFMAAGEEKTIYTFPTGYGYPIGKNDAWFLNYMIHDLTDNGAKVYITYDIDFVPTSSPAAASIKPLHPIWMDVESHNIYPVFDVHRFSGKNGKFTFPDMAKNPYHGGAPLNTFTVDHPGTIVATAGHVHPGGLYDELDDVRAGATPSGGAIAGSVPHSVRLFRSLAHYFDPRGPISWDMAMTATAPDWRPHLNAGDTLRISATYETKRASWYEAMGIMVAWEAWDSESGGVPGSTDPFSHATDQTGHVTHGHLAENRHHGGSVFVGVKLKKFPPVLHPPSHHRRVPLHPRGLHLDRPRPLHPDDPPGPVPDVRQQRLDRRRQALKRAVRHGHVAADPGLHQLDLPQRHLLPVPVRAGHRDLVPPRQRRGQLRLRSARA